MNGQWAVKVMNLLGQWLHLCIQAARPEDVPEDMEMVARSGDWQFKVKIEFERVERLTDEQLNALFGLGEEWKS